MTNIPDFTDSEMWVVKATLDERYGTAPELQLAETELRLDKGSTRLASCPTLYWTVDNCHFVVCKTGDKTYRCQFFYRIHQMYGTGITEYDDLAECVVSLLQVQADYQAQQQPANESN